MKVLEPNGREVDVSKREAVLVERHAILAKSEATVASMMEMVK